MSGSGPIRIGVDLGGTKLLVEALDVEGQVVASRLTATPRHDYEATLAAITELVGEVEGELGDKAPVGIGIPGSICPANGLVQNANSVWLNGQPFQQDICRHLDRDVRVANDANCFVLSEALDGAGVGAASVFGVIMGTGIGGGLVVDERLIDGPRGIGGEWGHCGLPFPSADEVSGAPECWCGRRGCLESWISGPALVARFNKSAGMNVLRVEDITALAAEGDAVASMTLLAHTDRVARGLAMVVNVFDPEVIVLGGGLSELDHLYGQLPDLMRPHIFSDAPAVDIRRPKYGATSGVRGAARLWPLSP